MFAWQPATPSEHAEYQTVPAHGSEDWTVSMRDDPAIQYRPSCARCNYPGETDYQAIFAYAYLPNPDEHVPDLLRCGLRSAPVPCACGAPRRGAADALILSRDALFSKNIPRLFDTTRRMDVGWKQQQEEVPSPL